MKFSVITENFSKGLSSASKAISVKATLPVLSNVLLETDNGRIKISASDLEKTVSVWVGAKVEEEGSITVPARVLLEFVSSLKLPQIAVKTEGNSLILEGEDVVSRFTGMPAEEFPKLPNFNDVSLICSLPAKDLLDIISKISFASATDDSRPVLTGVLIKVLEDVATFAAVDGFRLAETKIKLAKKTEKELSFVVPARSLSEAARIMGTGTSDIKLGFLENDNAFSLEGTDTFITIRVLDGEFPDYSKIIPQDSVSTITFNLLDFSQSVKLTGVFAKDESKIIKMNILETNQIEINAETQEIGEAKSTFKCKLEGEPQKIAFNSKFLTDFINCLPGGELEVTLLTMGALSPALFHVSGFPDYQYVVMPVRVSA